MELMRHWSLTQSKIIPKQENIMKISDDDQFNLTNGKESPISPILPDSEEHEKLNLGRKNIMKMEQQKRNGGYTTISILKTESDE